MCRFIFLFVLTMIVANTAAANALEDRMQALETKLKNLEQTYLTNNRDVAAAVARAESLQRSATGLQGTMEADRHLIDTQAQEMHRLFSDLDHRLQAMEERLQVFSMEMSKALVKIAPQAADEGALYQAGLDNIHDASYLEAAAAFQAFLKKYPKSQFAPPAQYWIGESYFSVRDWRQAIKEYQKLIDKYPRHEKVKNALLNQGIAFVELGLNDDAKPFFEKIVKNFSGSQEALEAQSRLDRLANPAPTPAASAASAPLDSYPTETLSEQRAHHQPPSSPPPTVADPYTKKQPLEF